MNKRGQCALEKMLDRQKTLGDEVALGRQRNAERGETNVH